MQITRKTLQDQIIPSIFYDKDGKRMIKSVQGYLDENSISKGEILSIFKNLDDYKDEGFWTFFVDICNNCFFSQIEVNITDESFENMVNQIQEARFDHIFEEHDCMRIVNKGILQNYLEEHVETDSTLNLSCSDCYRLIVPYQKQFSVNIEHHTPRRMNEYPNYLVKISGDKIAICSNSKKNRDSFFKHIKDLTSDLVDESVIEEFSTDKLDHLDINLHDFFLNLRESRIFVKKIKFNNKFLYFNVGLKDLIDINELINYDYILNSKTDIIAFKDIEFIYSTLINNESHDFRFKVTTSFKDLGENKYVKFMIIHYKDKYLNKSVEDNIENIFMENGLYFNHSYNLPSEYFINNIINENKSIKADYEKLMQLDPGNKTINKLIEENVLNIDDQTTINAEKLSVFKNKILKELENTSISINDSEYMIKDVKIDSKKRQTLTVRQIKGDHTRGKYKVIIYPYVRDTSTYNKVTSIIFPTINYSYIIKNILDEKKHLSLKYICSMIDVYLKNKYNLILEKEANNSYEFLKKYCQDWEHIDNYYKPHKAGNLVEKHLNVILKFIFRNYLLVGGQRAPDGYLTLNGEYYILDSKQHKSISQAEYDKVVRYVFNYGPTQGLEDANNGVFIVCRGKINNSLNIEARRSWQNSPHFNSQYNMSFITIEYFLNIFVYIKESRVRSKPDMLNKIYDTFELIVSHSSNHQYSRELFELENTLLNNINDSINEIVYTPTRWDHL